MGKAMKAAKAMKAVKAMKAMKAKKVMKKVSARLAKRHVFFGKASKTNGGKIVSKKASERAKKSPWIKACAAARAALKIKGFAVIKKGTPLYKKAQELYKK